MSILIETLESLKKTYKDLIKYYEAHPYYPAYGMNSRVDAYENAILAVDEKIEKHRIEMRLK